MIRLKKPNDRTNHSYFEERLSAYLDGELMPQEQEAIEHHLDDCPACQWNLDTLRQTVQWTRELQPLTVPRVFTITVPAEPQPIPRRRWNLTPLLGGATALVALLLVFAVAGGSWLGSFRGAAVPDAWTAQEAAPAVAATEVAVAAAPEERPQVEATAVVEMMVETVVETVEVELEVAVETEPVTAPRAQIAHPADAESKTGLTPTIGTVPESAVAAEAPPAAEGEAAEEYEQVVDESPAHEETQAGEASPEAQPENIAAAGGPTPEAEGTPLALLAEQPEADMASQAEDSVSSELDEQESTSPLDQEWQGANWLRSVQYALAALFLVLLAVTVVVAMRRRRAR
jgi:predicted anti-sigma-YlaC factor YlaD